jgi:hypothetical protein
MRAETLLEKKISSIFRLNLYLMHHDQSIAVPGSRESEHHQFKSARREEKANKSDVHRELQVVCLHVTSGGGASSSSNVSMLLLFSSWFGSTFRNEMWR